MTDLVICETCEVRHYENCRCCFGFGVKNVAVPVSAEEAHNARADGAQFNPCPVCGSTIYGVPNA